mmetsp:Transcript_27721/g.69479  ORF Transcript_27721/g.69479 Transcript_27721/m.69479 type:complete len:82 (-) Transcript_27721:418-663(-)
MDTLKLSYSPQPRRLLPPRSYSYLNLSSGDDVFPSVTYAAATASTSTKNSGRANPDTTIRVDAGGPCGHSSPSSILSRARM